MSYDTHSMVYRLGQRARFYRFRHLRVVATLRAYIRWKVAFGVFGLVAASSIGAGAAPQGIMPQVLGFGKKHIPPNSQTASTVSAKKVGSSKPPPKGAVTAVTVASPPASVLRTEGCDVFGAAHAGLATSSAPELRKLAQYEQLCGGSVAERSSFFVPTPATTAQAQTSAGQVAATLKAYAQAGVTPLVFMEPDDLNGANLDLAQYAKGAYDDALATYFATLQANGITSAMMGMWVLVPEGNLPVWSTVDPAIYTAVVTKTAQAQKKYFPSSQSSIMLDSESYPIGGTWGDGHYVSLAPYVQNIPKGLLDSFGLQGFPWAGPANQPPSTLYDPAVYLRTDFAAQAAQILGVHSIWFNTGTFGQMYANQAGQTIAVTPAQRQAMLSGVVQLAAKAKEQGFTVAIHLFAQNKANLSEGTDWSYWQNQPGGDATTAVFATFAHDAAAAGLPIWLYDTAGS
jgi:hypothetical protein